MFAEEAADGEEAREERLERAGRRRRGTQVGGREDRTADGTE